jgi:hypothetical protein
VGYSGLCRTEKALEGVGNKSGQIHRIRRHAPEGALVVLGNVAECREQDFVYGSVVAGEVDHEGAADGGGDAFMLVELHHIEEVARMLPIHGGDQFSAVELLV